MFLPRNLLRPSWFTLLLLVIKLCGGKGGSCPSVCTCKWKGGKQTVECMDRALITIPEGVDPETQVLDLSGNNLQILPRETFVRAGLLNLQRVFLRSCRIGQIDDLAFRGLTNLIELDLSHNLLTAVPSATFQDVPFLRDLILSSNPIQKIDSHAFQTVPGLVKLDMSNCDLQMVSPKAFEGIELLESLKLNGNRLSELRPRTVETLSRLHGVELHDNPWHCDCRLRPVKEWLTHHNIPYPVAPVCSGGPERVIHKTFAELHVDDFACKPEILPVNRYIEATAAENATILCRASAVPSAHINWYWNGRLLVNNSAFSSHQKIFIFEDGHFEKRSNLILTNAQETDSSEFYCVAENRAGNAEANFTLRVSMRAAGMVTLGSGHIAGLSAALVVLILFILLVILAMLIRLRRIPYSESKTPGQVEVVTVVNGSTIPNGKSIISPTNPNMETSSFTERKLPSDLNFCNPVQKPPRLNDISYTTTHYNGNGSVMNPGSCFVSPSSGSGNNPDLINDTKIIGSDDQTNSTIVYSGTDDTYSTETLERAGSGEYSRNADSLYPSGLWEPSDADMYTRANSTTNPGFHYDDKTPIIGDGSVGGSEEELSFRLSHGTNRAAGYPSDYGLPIVEGRGDGAENRGQEARGHEGRGQDGRGQNLRGQEGRGQEGRGQEGRGQEGRGQDGRGQEGRVQDGRGPDGRGQDGHGHGVIDTRAHSIIDGRGHATLDARSHGTSGLTITAAATQVNLPTNAKTLRVWQKGAVPVLPPVTALKRALSHNRNSPDEGYQEGCGTDV